MIVKKPSTEREGPTNFMIILSMLQEVTGMKTTIGYMEK